MVSAAVSDRVGAKIFAVIEDRTIQSPAQLDDWLGVDRTSNNGNGARYPKCRFMYAAAVYRIFTID